MLGSMKLGLGNFRTASNTPEAQLVEEGWSNLEPAALPQSLSPSSHASSSLSAATLCLRIKLEGRVPEFAATAAAAAAVRAGFN